MNAKAWAAVFVYVVTSLVTSADTTVTPTVTNTAETLSTSPVATPATTNALTTALAISSTTSLTPVVFYLTFVIKCQYIPAFNDYSSPEYRYLSDMMVFYVEQVYRNHYGVLFISATLIAFRPELPDMTKVEFEITFKQNSTKPIPSSSELVQTFKGSNFSFVLDSFPVSIYQITGRTPVAESTAAATNTPTTTLSTSFTTITAQTSTAVATTAPATTKTPTTTLGTSTTPTATNTPITTSTPATTNTPTITLATSTTTTAPTTPITTSTPATTNTPTITLATSTTATTATSTLIATSTPATTKPTTTLATSSTTTTATTTPSTTTSTSTLAMSTNSTTAATSTKIVTRTPVTTNTLTPTLATSTTATTASTPVATSTSATTNPPTTTLSTSTTTTAATSTPVATSTPATTNAPTTSLGTSTTSRTDSTTTSNPVVTTTKNTPTTMSTTTITPTPTRTATNAILLTTTAAVTTTLAPTQPPLAADLKFVLRQEYIPALNNTNSVEYKSLETEVVDAFTQVYRKQYRELFKKVLLVAFRPGPTRASQSVEADVQLIFNQNSTKPIPSSSEVVQTLKEAITNQTTFFNLTVDATSINIISFPQTVPVIFLTNGTFTSDLSDSSSTLFTNQALMIKSGLDPFFAADYPTIFITLTISKFSDGGLTSVSRIQNFIELLFSESATLPNSSQIAQTIIRAARHNTLPFQIFTSEITVNGTVISSGEISSKISMFIAFFMVAMSLLLTSS